MVNKDEYNAVMFLLCLPLQRPTTPLTARRQSVMKNNNILVQFTDASGVLSVTASSPMPTTALNNISTSTIIIVCVAALILIELIIVMIIIVLFVCRRRGQYCELNCKIWAFKYDEKCKRTGIRCIPNMGILITIVVVQFLL